MRNTSVRLGDLREWVRSEEQKRGVSKAQVIRDCVRAAAEGEGVYGDADDADLRDRLDRLEQRVNQLEASRSGPVTEPVASRKRAGGGSEPATTEPAREPDRADSESVADGGGGSKRATTGSEPSRREEIADSLRAADLDDAMYSPTATRVNAAAEAFARLAEAQSATTAELVEVVEETDADVSAPNRLLGDFGAALDAVETPGRGSNRYEWVGE